MKPGSLIYILLLTFSLISCEEKTYNEFTGDGTLLKEIVGNGEIFYKYTYNDADFIREEKSKFHYTEHFYNNKNQLTQSDHYWDERIASSNSEILQEALKRTEWVTPENTARGFFTTFEYDNKGQLKKSTLHENIVRNEFSTYAYNDRHIEKKISYFDNQQAALETYFYDQKGNLTKSEKYLFVAEAQPKLSSSTEYFYDDKNNPCFSFRSLMIPGEHTNKNNIVKETYTIYSLTNESAEEVQIKEYSYSYNAKGFPVQRSDGIEYTYY